MEDIVAQLDLGCDTDETTKNCSTSTEGGDADAQHPRYSNYKNEGKIAEKQRKRREEHLQRQNGARDEWLNKSRNIEKEAAANHAHQRNPFAQRPKGYTPNKANYKDFLMHSDWLVDIPVALSTDWTLVPSPKGRRCLVVAQKGITNIYYRNGQFAHSFETVLPGGNPKTAGSMTILDCICSNRTISMKAKYYVLDLLWWKNSMFTDMEFTMRQFFLRSKIEELDLEDKDNNQFVMLPSCACSAEEMTKFMQSEFDYELDGLLFYNNSAYYIAEQTPLVGWLKPWMLPEILAIPVPERYMMEKPEYSNTQSFIDAYNKQHGHTSSEVRNKAIIEKEEEEKKKLEQQLIVDKDE